MKLRLRLKIFGVSPVQYDLALRLAESGYEVELCESADTGFVRKAPISDLRCLKLAHALKMELPAFLERTFATRVKSFSVQGRSTRPFVDQRKKWICEESLRALLRAEWLRRGFLLSESRQRFDAIQSTRMGHSDLSLHNSRGEMLKPFERPDGERSSRWFSKIYLFPRLRGWDEALDLRFVGQTRVLTNAGRVGTEVFVLAPTRAAIAEFESLIADRKLGAAHPHFKLIEKLRSHWLAGAEGSFQHQEQSYDVAPKFAARGPVLSWGESVGELPPLFNGSLEHEFDQADEMVRSFRYFDRQESVHISKAVSLLQARLQNFYGEASRRLSFWEFVLKDPLLGRGLTTVLSLTPGVIRSWLELPF